MNNEKVTKRYTIEWIEYTDEDGKPKTKLQRTCQGFNAYELLGLVTLAKSEIVQQIKGDVKPDIIERKVINDSAP